MRRPLWRFLLSTLLVLLVVTAASVAGVWWAAREESQNVARDTAHSFARLVVSPLRMTDLEHSTQAETRSILDRTVAGMLAHEEIFRIKIWKVEGDSEARIVYSDLSRIEGMRVPVSPDLGRALDTGLPVVIPVPDDEVHATEQRDDGQALEVYLAFEDADGTVAVVELYMVTRNTDRMRELLTHTVPVAIGGPVLLMALTLPLALRLARRSAEGVSQRRDLVEQALTASEAERRRLAQLLHDGPVQDLAALGMMLERSAAVSSDEGGLDAAEQVRAQVCQLRDLLDVLDPIETEHTSLSEVVRSVEDGLPATTTKVTVAGDEVEIAARATRILVHRCAAELVRNALTHSGARDVEVRLSRSGGGVDLVVVDDGRGFDPDGAVPGHHGLRLIGSAVAGAGGSLTIDSGAAGTTVRISVPEEALAPDRS